PARAGLPAPLTAGSGTIGVRVSSHPYAAALVGGLGAPVTAPSANPPGAEPPRRLAEARAYFGERVAVYLEGGRLRGGASTVAAIEGDRLRILRPGLVSEAELRAALGEGGCPPSLRSPPFATIPPGSATRARCWRPPTPSS